MRVFLATVSLSLVTSTVVASQNPPLRTLAQPQAEFAEPFTEIGAVRELSDGRVIVVDARELTVKLLDFRAGSTTTIGRSGDGPGEYRWPRRLYALSGDSTLLQDAAGGRLMIIQPDGKPGGFYDPNQIETDSGLARVRRFNLRSSDGRRFLYGEAQPIKIGANGALERADHSAIERLEFSTKKRTWPEFLPPYRGTGQFAPDGSIWISRMTAAGRPPLFDVIDGNGRLVGRVELPARTKLVGFGSKSVYVVRLDQDDLQYMQRYSLPTVSRP